MDQSAQGCSMEGMSVCTSTLVYCGQRGPKCFASGLSLLGSVSPVGQWGSGGLQLLCLDPQC